MSKNNRVLIIAADGYEDLELTAPLDILKRNGFDVTIAVSSKNENNTIRSSSGLTILGSETLKTIVSKLKDFNFLIIPGGDISATNLNQAFETTTIISHFVENNKKIAAICAGPTLLANRGYLKNRFATCYPAKKYQSILIANGAKIKKLNCKHDEECSIIEDGNFLTALDYLTAVKFAFRLVDFFS